MQRVWELINRLEPEQDGWNLTDNIYECIVWNVNCYLINIWLKFVAKGLIYKSALVQVMAWCRTGTKPLPDPMMTQFTDKY